MNNDYTNSASTYKLRKELERNAKKVARRNDLLIDLIAVVFALLAVKGIHSLIV